MGMNLCTWKLNEKSDIYQLLDGVEQTTYRDLLGMPKAEANNWSPSLRKITTICKNRVQLLFYHSLIIESVLSLT